MCNVILLFQKVQCFILTEVLIRVTDIQMVVMGKLTNEYHQVFYPVTNLHFFTNALVYNMLFTFLYNKS